MSFYISSPRYYHRELKLLRSYDDRMLSVLSNENDSPQSVELGLYSDTLNLAIFNGDDQPLAVDSIKAYIRKYCLIVELRKGQNYMLTYGDKSLPFPQYDLSFAKQVPDSIVCLTVGAIQQIAVADKREETSAWMVFVKTYGIWIVIILIIAQILYMIRRMTK